MEIVGLKQKVPDNINSLISKFVGVKPHPIAEMFKSKIEHINNNCFLTEGLMEEALHYILRMKQSRVICRVHKTYAMLEKLNNDKKRRSEFIKVRRWV